MLSITISAQWIRISAISKMFRYLESWKKNIENREIMAVALVALMFLGLVIGLSSLHVLTLGHGKAIRSTSSPYSLAARKNLTAYTNGLLKASVQQASAM